MVACLNTGNLAVAESCVANITVPLIIVVNPAKPATDGRYGVFCKERFGRGKIADHQVKTAGDADELRVGTLRPSPARRQSCRLYSQKDYEKRRWERRASCYPNSRRDGFDSWRWYA